MLIDPEELKFARRHAPILRIDRREPFLPSRVGVTVFREPGESPSFPRAVVIPPGADLTIEYAIWWDWDIQHLYELEHVWIAVEKSGRVVAVEASWHGILHRFPHWRMEDTHPVLYSQPGKHAFAPDPYHFPRWGTWYACTVGAGAMGLLVKDIFTEALTPTEDVDRAIRRYLRRFAFVPTFRFSREVHFPPEAFTTWESLKAYIPERVKAVVTELLERSKLRKEEGREVRVRRRRHRTFG
jgi:putative hydrolase of the HAD superfamily